MPDITKGKLIEIIKGLLGIDADLNFLVKLDENDLETLIASIRDRIEQAGKIADKITPLRPTEL